MPLFLGGVFGSSVPRKNKKKEENKEEKKKILSSRPGAGLPVGPVKKAPLQVSVQFRQKTKQCCIAI